MRQTKVSFRMLQTTSLTRALRLAAITLGIGLVMSAGPVRAGDDEEDDGCVYDSTSCREASSPTARMLRPTFFSS